MKVRIEKLARLRNYEAAWLMGLFFPENTLDYDGHIEVSRLALTEFRTYFGRDLRQALEEVEK